MKRKKYISKNVFISFIFILSMVLPMLFINKIQNIKSDTENRYLAKFPNIINQEDGTFEFNNFKSGFENWLNDNIGFRKEFIKANLYIQYNLLKTSPVSRVEVGKDGWFFYTYDDITLIPRGKYPLDDNKLRKIKDGQESIKEYLNKQNIEYILLLPPSKPSIYPEKIKTGNFIVRETPVDIIEKYLLQNSKVNVLNLKPYLLEAKKDNQVYFKTDTHWNYYGAYVGYSALINYINNIGFMDSEAVSVNLVPDEFRGEFSTMMGDINVLPAEEIYYTEIIKPNAIKETEGEIINKLNNIKDTYGMTFSSLYRYTNPNGNGKKVLVFGDSMLNAWNFTELLAENFSELTHIGTYQSQLTQQLKQPIIDIVEPDLVIMELVERYSVHLARDVDSRIKYPPLTNASSKIISDTTLTSIDSNKPYDFEITIENTGEESWSESKRVRLCVFQDGKDYGYRIIIPDNTEVKPGEQFKFIFKDFVAPSSEKTYLEYQMIEEGINWFGEKRRIDISIKN